MDGLSKGVLASAVLSTGGAAKRAAGCHRHAEAAAFGRGQLPQVVRLVSRGSRGLVREVGLLGGRNYDAVGGVLLAICGRVTGEAVILQTAAASEQATKLSQAVGAENGGRALAVVTHVICLGSVGQGHA